MSPEWTLLREDSNLSAFAPSTVEGLRRTRHCSPSLCIHAEASDGGQPSG